MKKSSKKRSSDDMKGSSIDSVELHPNKEQCIGHPGESKVKKTGESISSKDFAKWSKREQWAWLFAYEFESGFGGLGFTKDDSSAFDIAQNLFKVRSDFSIGVPSSLNRMTPEQRDDLAKKRIAEIREAFDWFDKLEQPVEKK